MPGSAWPGLARPDSAVNSFNSTLLWSQAKSSSINLITLLNMTDTLFVSDRVLASWRFARIWTILALFLSEYEKFDGYEFCMFRNWMFTSFWLYSDGPRWAPEWIEPFLDIYIILETWKPFLSQCNKIARTAKFLLPIGQ